MFPQKLEAHEKIYLQGCLKGFGSWLERNTIIVGAVCLGIVIPQVSNQGASPTGFEKRSIIFKNICGEFLAHGVL